MDRVHSKGCAYVKSNLCTSLPNAHEQPEQFATSCAPRSIAEKCPPWLTSASWWTTWIIQVPNSTTLVKTGYGYAMRYDILIAEKAQSFRRHWAKNAGYRQKELCEMEATRPLLGNGDRDGDDVAHDSAYTHSSHHKRRNGSLMSASASALSTSQHRRPSLLIIEDTTSSDDNCCTGCYRVICCLSSSDGPAFTSVASPSSGYKELPPHRDGLLSNGTSSSTGSSRSYNGTTTNHHYPIDNGKAYQGFVFANWGCWKWMFPERVADYDDFAASEEMGEIHYIRQKTREFFDASHTDDAEMVQHLWNALFPMLPYDGRVNARWRDVGFQNDDPGSDFRSSGRFGLKMLLYFADHMNEEFKRLVRENRFPVCLCAINVIEMLLIHLNLKDPLPLVCPCCGTDNAELETSNPSRDRPELKGFVSILNDCSWSASRANHNLGYASEWPIEVAFAQLFMHTMIVLDCVWKQQLQRDPSMTLMHFRDALYETNKKVIAFLSRRNSPVDLVELAAWSARYKHAKTKTKAPKTKSSRTCL